MQLSKGDEVDKLVVPILKKLMNKNNARKSHREGSEVEKVSLDLDEKHLCLLIMYLPFFKIKQETYLIGTMKR